MLKKISMFTVVMVFAAAAAYAAPADVPRSGQTVCWPEGGFPSYCFESAGAGQDGALLTGVPWPDTRFTDNADGTVTDNLTGLMWLKDANCINTQYSAFDTDGGADGAVPWQHALDFVAGINAGTYPNCGGGHTGWRLPNVNELESLVHAQYISYCSGYACTSNAEWLNTWGLSNVQAEYYWSSTTYAGPDVGPMAGAWLVDMHAGEVFANDKAFYYYVWPVRSGQ